MTPYALVSKVVTLAPTTTPGDIVVVPFEYSHPYRDLTSWFVGGISAGGSVTAQPVLSLNNPSVPALDQAMVNDGGSVALTAASSPIKKLYQESIGEIRPPSQGIKEYPGDAEVVQSFVSAIKFTNNTAAPERFGVFMTAVAAPTGG